MDDQDLVGSEDTASAGRAGSGTTIWHFVILFAVASYTPFDTLLANSEGPSPVTAVVVAIGVFLAAVVIRWLLIRLGLDPTGSTYAVAVCLLVLLAGGPLVGVLPGGRWTAILCAAMVAAMFYRLRENLIIRMTMVGGTVALLVSPLIVYVGDRANADTETHFEYAVENLGVTDERDLVVVIVDGYANRAVLEEFYETDNSAFIGDLEMLGFEVPFGVVSNYSETFLSVPSLLQMEYIEASAPLTFTDREVLFGMLGGDNTLTETMQKAGYETVYVESGWAGTRCGEQIDVCVPGPIPDDLYYDIVHRSLLREAPGFETGTPFSRGALSSLAWMDQELESYLNDGRKSFIYVHVLAPHPPLFLDADCASHPSAALAGFAIGLPGMADSELAARKSGYLSQVECVNSVLENVARAAVASDAVAVFAGDHGPDLGAQLALTSDVWTEEQIRERMGPFVALYGRECGPGHVDSLLDVGSWVMACMGGTPKPQEALRLFRVELLRPGEGRLTEIPAPRYQPS